MLSTSTEQERELKDRDRYSRTSKLVASRCTQRHPILSARPVEVTGRDAAVQDGMPGRGRAGSGGTLTRKDRREQGRPGERVGPS